MTETPLDTSGNLQRARNVGSNFTTFRYAGKAIAYLQSVGDSGQPAIAAPVAVQPLGYRHPIEIVTPRAVGAGTLTLTITELWHQEVWEQMQGLAGTTDIVEVFERLAATPQYVTCTKIINPPDGRRYGKVYHRCVISDIQDGETVTLPQMLANKSIQVMYTHTTPL